MQDTHESGERDIVLGPVGDFSGRDPLGRSRGGVFGVIDIETAPDPMATALMRTRDGARINSAAHRIETVALLRARELDDGTWVDFRLTTPSMPRLEEPAILSVADEFLRGLSADDGTCVTFNGRSHDFAVLRRRAARFWMFECAGIDAAARLRHADLMRVMTRGWRDEWPSLAAACAGLTIPANHLPEDTLRRWSIKERKAQTDVLSTFLLLLYELAMRRRDIATLGLGWSALADFLKSFDRRAPHLQQFASHAFLKGWAEGSAQTA